MSAKPVVDFVAESVKWRGHGDCESARVFAINHPRLGTCTVYTSPIVRRFDDGSFETKNTVYRPRSAVYNEALQSLASIDREIGLFEESK